MNRNLASLLVTGTVVVAFAAPSFNSGPSSNLASTAQTKSAGSKADRRVATNNHPVGSEPSPDDDIKDALEEFYEKEKAANIQVFADKLPHPDGASAEFLIVTAPDPVETHLSLFFDRTMDALQQALTREGYLFAGSTLPWDPKEHPESTDWRIRESQASFEQAREDVPGLLIYRRPPDNDGNAREPLFVLVVGETPTTGIHKDQFVKALAFVDKWSGAASSADRKQLRVLGPTFSGSLYSLLEIFDSEPQLKNYEIYLHSGTVSSCSTVERFRSTVARRNLQNVHFVSFQENDSYAFQRFLEYVRSQGYLTRQGWQADEKPDSWTRTWRAVLDFFRRNKESAPPKPPLPRIRDVVLLTEDESAYGGSPQNGAGRDHGCGSNSDVTLMATLTFPRDISQLRSAYQQDFLQAESSSDRKTLPRTSLPLNLDDTGGDKDTVVSYAHRQTPLSQESVLFAIVTTLKKLRPSFVIIRATNPLDELFLARFLRKSYPQTRLVTVGADLLFQQQRDDSSLRGILALSTYSLRPDVDRYIRSIVKTQTEHTSLLTFPSTFSAGVYNAALSLLACDGQRVCKEAPAAAYHEFGWSSQWPPKDPSDPALLVAQPELWLLVLGNDGYWPLARLSDAKFSAQLNAVDRTVPSTEPEVSVLYGVDYTLTKDWTQFGLLVIVTALIFCVLCWIGSTEFGARFFPAFDTYPDQQRVIFLSLIGAILLIATSGLLVPILFNLRYDATAWFVYAAGLIVLFIVVISMKSTLWRRGAKKAWWTYNVLCVVDLLTLCLIPFVPPVFLHFSLDRLLLFRIEHILSGVSPALPVYLLLASLLCWCWCALQGQAFLDDRRPRLPASNDFAQHLDWLGLRNADLTESGVRQLLFILHSPVPGLPEFLEKVTKPIRQSFSQAKSFKKALGDTLVSIWEHRSDLWITGLVSLPVAVALWLLAPHLLDQSHPIKALEGAPFEKAFSFLCSLALFLLLTDLVRLVAAWLACRRLLGALELLPLRRGLTDIKGFSWRPIWRLGHGSQRILAPQWESWCRYCRTRNLTRAKADEQEVAELSKRNGFFAKKCNEVLLFLATEWKKHDPPSTKEGTQVNCCSECDEPEDDPAPSPAVKEAERFVCFVYLNFILTVLHRLRTFGFSVAGVYMFLLLALTSYPFEPRLAIRSFLVLLLLLILGVVTFVYVQVYRDPTLSRITNTKAGELGFDFWIRILSFATLPTLTLLAAQYPAIGGALFSWLQPALDALAK